MGADFHQVHTERRNVVRIGEETVSERPLLSKERVVLTTTEPQGGIGEG